MGTNNIRILFTGVGRRVELIQAFRQAALALDIKIKIYGADSSTSAPALAFCDCRRKICSMGDSGYIDSLLGICKDDKINLIIPAIDTDLLVLSEHRAEFEQAGIKVLASPVEAVRICRDKNLTSRFFKQCGLKSPETVRNWVSYTGGYPAFIKPKDGSSSIHAYKVQNRGELEVFASRVPEYIVQPFIDGTEYTVDIFADFDGEPIFIIPRVRLAVRAGEVQKTQVDMDLKMIAGCKKIVRKLHPCGPVTVQVIREAGTGEDYYIEINPRFGGGAPLSMKAGADSARELLLLLSGNEKMPDNSGKEAGGYPSRIQDGAVYSRFDQSVCVKRGDGPYLIKGVVFDLDDTLYPEKEYVKSGFRKVAGFLGNEGLADRLWGYFKAGKPAVDECLKELGKTGQKSKCLEIYRNHYPDIHFYDGVAGLIRKLKENSIRVGVITDGRLKGQRNKIAALGLDKLVADIIVTDELGGEQFRKPCDIAFRIMALRWKLPYENMVYIGDNAEKDFQAPQQLGMQWIWFRNKGGLHQAVGAAYSGAYVDRLEDIDRIIFGQRMEGECYRD